MMETASHRIMRLYRCNKVTGYQASALMYELIESVLTISARLAPHNRTRAIVDVDVVCIDELALLFKTTFLIISFFKV